MKVVGRGEETAVGERGVRHSHVVGIHPQELRPRHLAGLVARRGGWQAKLAHSAEQGHRYLLDRRALFLDGQGILVAERLTQPLFTCEPMQRTHLQLVDPDDSRAKLLSRLHQLCIETGNDGSYGNHRGGANEHAQHRKK